jgi:hypothetical protein
VHQVGFIAHTFQDAWSTKQNKKKEHWVHGTWNINTFLQTMQELPSLAVKACAILLDCVLWDTCKELQPWWYQWCHQYSLSFTCFDSFNAYLKKTLQKYVACCTVWTVPVYDVDSWSGSVLLPSLSDCGQHLTDSSSVHNCTALHPDVLVSLCFYLPFEASVSALLAALSIECVLMFLDCV